MTATVRELFLLWALEQLGKPTLMSAKGDYYVDHASGQVMRVAQDSIFDCSGLVTAALRVATAADRRATHNAQVLFGVTAPVEVPEIGDLGFYGADAAHVSHVVIALAGGHLLSADGACATITTPGAAQADPHCRVRVHHSVAYRSDVPFLGWRSVLPLLSPPPVAPES